MPQSPTPPMHPFSVRFAPEERARLEREAAGVPLGQLIRAKALGEPIPSRFRRSGLPVEDREALAKILALLGASRIASNLNQLARLANVGALPVDPETTADLNEAVRFVAEIGLLLLTALGKRPEAAP